MANSLAQHLSPTRLCRNAPTSKLVPVLELVPCSVMLPVSSAAGVTSKEGCQIYTWRCASGGHRYKQEYQKHLDSMFISLRVPFESSSSGMLQELSKQNRRPEDSRGPYVDPLYYDAQSPKMCQFLVPLLLNGDARSIGQLQVHSGYRSCDEERDPAIQMNHQCSVTIPLAEMRAHTSGRTTLAEQAANRKKTDSKCTSHLGGDNPRIYRNSVKDSATFRQLCWCEHLWASC